MHATRMRVSSVAALGTAAHSHMAYMYVFQYEVESTQMNAGNYLSGSAIPIVLGKNVYSVVGMLETDHSRIGRQRE